MYKIKERQIYEKVVYTYPSGKKNINI